MNQTAQIATLARRAAIVSRLALTDTMNETLKAFSSEAQTAQLVALAKRVAAWRTR